MALSLNVCVSQTAMAALLVWCSAVQADIVQRHGADGRTYYTNIPLATPPSVPKTTRGRRSSAAAQGKVLALMHRLARQHNIDPHLVQAIITVESNFNPHAVSHAGAQGLMQLMPTTAARYRVRNPFDPQANMAGGIRYLKDLFVLFPDDLKRVLAAYNAGEGAVQRYGGIPPYPETQRYVERVLTLYGHRPPPPRPKIYRYHTTTGSILFTNMPR